MGDVLLLGAAQDAVQFVTLQRQAQRLAVVEDPLTQFVSLRLRVVGHRRRPRQGVLDNRPSGEAPPDSHRSSWGDTDRPSTPAPAEVGPERPESAPRTGTRTRDNAPRARWLPARHRAGRG